MRTLTFLMALSICTFGIASMEGAQKGSRETTGPKIRVLLEKDTKSALLEVKGAYEVVRKDNAQILSTGTTGKRFVVHALQDGLRWGEEYPDVFSIAVIPSSQSTMMYVNGIQYKGAISIYHCRDNKVTIINDVPIEDYLKSTLTMEMHDPVSSEALAACVIAERTTAFAVAKSGKSSKRPWDVTAKECNYFGYAVRCEKDWLESAVDATKFMVLDEGVDAYPNLKLSPIDAEELAARGFDAKKILQSSFPKAKLSVNLPQKQVAAR